MKQIVYVACMHVIYMVQFFLCTICWTIKWWGTIQPQQLYYRFFSIFTVAESISWELWLSHGSTRIDITSRILPHAGLHAWNFVQPTCDQHMLLRTQIASAVWREIKTQSIYFGLMILGKFDLGFITIYIKYQGSKVKSKISEMTTQNRSPNRGCSVVMALAPELLLHRLFRCLGWGCRRFRGLAFRGLCLIRQSLFGFLRISILFGSPSITFLRSSFARRLFAWTRFANLLLIVLLQLPADSQLCIYGQIDWIIYTSPNSFGVIYVKSTWFGTFWNQRRIENHRALL